MPKTFNGRPQKLGTMYFEERDEITMKKYNCGYCPKCGVKIGITREELEEFAENMPGLVPDFVISLFAGLRDVKRFLRY